jgi:hypothetical protein
MTWQGGHSEVLRFFREHGTPPHHSNRGPCHSRAVSLLSPVFDEGFATAELCPTFECACPVLASRLPGSFGSGFVLRNVESRRPLDLMFLSHHAKLLRVQRPSCADSAFELLVGEMEEAPRAAANGTDAQNAVVAVPVGESRTAAVAVPGGDSRAAVPADNSTETMLATAAFRSLHHAVWHGSTADVISLVNARTLTWRQLRDAAEQSAARVRMVNELLPRSVHDW